MHADAPLGGEQFDQPLEAARGVARGHGRQQLATAEHVAGEDVVRAELEHEPEQPDQEQSCSKRVGCSK